MPCVAPASPPDWRAHPSADAHRTSAADALEASRVGAEPVFHARSELSVIGRQPIYLLRERGLAACGPTGALKCPAFEAIGDDGARATAGQQIGQSLIGVYGDELTLAEVSARPGFQHSAAIDRDPRGLARRRARTGRHARPRASGSPARRAWVARSLRPWPRRTRGSAFAPARSASESSPTRVRGPSRSPMPSRSRHRSLESAHQRRETRTARSRRSSPRAGRAGAGVPPSSPSKRRPAQARAEQREVGPRERRHRMARAAERHCHEGEAREPLHCRERHWRELGENAGLRQSPARSTSYPDRQAVSS